MADLTTLRALIEADLRETDQLIRTRLESDVELINDISNHILAGGGKRIRPMVTLLMSRALGCCETPHHLTAAIIELIHTATLLHDDVIDESSLRRGHPTANQVFGNSASVLTGDYLYSRAFEMMVDIGQLEVLKILASASNIITTGELMQLSNAYGGELAIDAYFTTIYRKTGKLFEAAAEIPALLTHPENVVYREACQQFGALLGTAFQIADDILDYQSTAEDMGKNVGDDVREGKLTLPVLYALERATPTQRAWIKHMFSEGDDSDIDQLFDVVKQTGALQRASEKALELAEQAAAFLEALPQNAYTTGLRGLVALAVNRVC